MSRLTAHPFWSDARHYQIAALATLLIFNIGWLDFGAQPFNSALRDRGCAGDAGGRARASSGCRRSTCARR